MNSPPFYLDWTFWSTAIALLALLLSQLPPIHQLVKGAKLEVEPFDRITVTHTVGNPNANLYVSIINAGGSTVAIRSMHLTVKRSDSAEFEMPARLYWPNQTDKQAVILPSFKLEPHEHWSHLVNFFRPFGRNEEKEYRQLVASIRDDINLKRAQLVNANNTAEAAAGRVNPLINFFTNRFKWEPGEYEVTLTVVANPNRASVSTKYRITLFESDAVELKNYSNDYKFGLGVYFFDSMRHPGVHILLSRA